jgi:hypothetical protein
MNKSKTSGRFNHRKCRADNRQHELQLNKALLSFAGSRTWGALLGNGSTQQNRHRSWALCQTCDIALAPTSRPQDVLSKISAYEFPSRLARSLLIKLHHATQKERTKTVADDPRPCRKRCARPWTPLAYDSKHQARLKKL